MMQVFLVRHGNSPFTAANDHQRMLSELGQRQAIQAAHFIKSHVHNAAVKIICSDAIRTLKTAELIAQQLTMSSMIADHRFYQARVGDWCDAISAHQTNQVLVLVGHNPTISFLSQYLNPLQQLNFSPACVAHYQLEIVEDGLKLPAQFKEFFIPNEQ